MLTLAIIVLLVISIALGKKHRKITAVLDVVVALLILFFEVIPGKAGTIDTILMVLLFVGGGFFFFAPDEMIK